jgi:hypothetical protein
MKKWANAVAGVALLALVAALIIQWRARQREQTALHEQTAERAPEAPRTAPFTKSPSNTAPVELARGPWCYGWAGVKMR